MSSWNDRGFEKGGSEFKGPKLQTSYKNFIGVGPKGYRRPDDSIFEEVCHVLAADPELDASEIEVSVSGGEVALRGKVDSRKSKFLAEDLILNLSGIRDVKNELRVKPYDFENMFTGMEDFDPDDVGLFERSSETI